MPQDSGDDLTPILIGALVIGALIYFAKKNATAAGTGIAVSAPAGSTGSTGSTALTALTNPTLQPISVNASNVPLPTVPGVTGGTGSTNPFSVSGMTF